VGQRHETDAIVEGVVEAVGDGDRQARLAAAAGAGHRQQAGGRLQDQAAALVDLALPPDQRAVLSGQPIPDLKRTRRREA
jgi:hypothetical protein